MIKKILNIACLTAILLTLVGCSIFRVYRQDIQQGNVVTSTQLKSIHRGMTQQQIINKLGYPVLSNIYYSKQLMYLYSYEPAYGKLTRQYLILSFKHNRVTNIKTNMEIPDYMLPKPTTRKKTTQTKKNEVALPQPTK